MDTPSRSQRTGDRGRPGKFRPLSSAFCAVKTPEPQRSRSAQRRSETTLRALGALCGARCVDRRYLISALAPASINFFKIAPASALDTASLTGLGAPSTKSLASFRPSPVTSRTALITLTLFSPNPVSTTVNSVCSSTAAAAPPPPAGAAAATVAAAADTPNLSSRSLISCDSSNTDMLEIASRISAFATDISFLLNQFRSGSLAALLRARRLSLVADRGEGARKARRHLVQRPYKLDDRGLHRAQKLREQLLARRHQRERGDFLGGNHGVRHGAGADHELLVRSGELVEHLGGRHRVGRDAVDERSLHVLGQPGKRRAFDGAARQGVLEDAQVHARLARFRAQLGHAAHFQTTVLSDDDRLRLRQLRGDFGDHRLLLVEIETQGLPPICQKPPVARTCGTHGDLALRKILHGVRHLRRTEGRFNIDFSCRLNLSVPTVFDNPPHAVQAARWPKVLSSIFSAAPSRRRQSSPRPPARPVPWSRTPTPCAGRVPSRWKAWTC